MAFHLAATPVTGTFHSSSLSLNRLGAEASVWHAIEVHHPSGYNLKCISSFFIAAPESLAVKVTSEGWFCVIKKEKKIKTTNSHRKLAGELHVSHLRSFSSTRFTVSLSNPLSSVPFCLSCAHHSKLSQSVNLQK